MLAVELAVASQKKSVLSAKQMENKIGIMDASLSVWSKSRSSFSWPDITRETADVFFLLLELNLNLQDCLKCLLAVEVEVELLVQILNTTPPTQKKILFFL